LHDGRDLPKDRLWESTHFRYHTRTNDPEPCEAVIVQLERHFELLQGYLGFSWPNGRKVDYYKFLDQAASGMPGWLPVLASAA
jgi:hypothetical protein